MNTHVWLTTTVLALAAIAAPLGDLVPTAEAAGLTECKQQQPWPPICCYHNYTVGDRAEPRNPVGNLKRASQYCPSWLP